MPPFVPLGTGTNEIGIRLEGRCNWILRCAPTDFYTSWLLRSTVGTREGVEVVVMNPSNGENSSDHEEFKKRMNSIFLRGNSAPFGRCRASLGWTAEGGCPQVILAES